MFLENITWLVLCIYFEARGESHNAKVGVAQVVMNRAIQRKQSIKEVVTAERQFSWYTGEGIPNIEEPEVLWRCAQAALSCMKRRAMGDTFAGANHFYDDSINPPYWVKSMFPLGKIGSFYFYRA